GCNPPIALNGTIVWWVTPTLRNPQNIYNFATVGATVSHNNRVTRSHLPGSDALASLGEVKTSLPKQGNP
ncbi:MAG: hypothetical protein U9N49_02435, partial [Campylobacterota bacterium]|nr:hypothetical protein [Campylobacterota bacterium]